MVSLEASVLNQKDNETASVFFGSDYSHMMVGRGALVGSDDGMIVAGSGSPRRSKKKQGSFENLNQLHIDALK